MTDVVNPVEETKPSSPELQASEQRIAEAQQQIQMMEREIAKGRRMLTITCLNLANLAVNLLPRPGQEGSGSKKNPANRVLTLADLDKVSAIVERLTQASSHLQGWSRGA